MKTSLAHLLDAISVLTPLEAWTVKEPTQKRTEKATGEELLGLIGTSNISLPHDSPPNQCKTQRRQPRAGRIDARTSVVEHPCRPPRTYPQLAKTRAH